MNQFLNQPFLPNLLAGVDEPDPILDMDEEVLRLQKILQNQVSLIQHQLLRIQNLEAALRVEKACNRIGNDRLPMGQYPEVLDLARDPFLPRKIMVLAPPPGQPPKYDTHIVLCQDRQFSVLNRDYNLKD